MTLGGLITAMVTPFDKDNTINWQATEKLIDHLISKQVSGLFILGTNGEFHVMTKEEKLDFAKYVVSYTNKRVPVYVGVGGNDTNEVISLAKDMESIGADALSVIAPYFVKLKEEELYEHFKAIATNVTIPVILYNMPGLTGNPLSPTLVKKLADITNIIGIKDSSGNIDNIKAYIDETKEKDFKVLSGSDSLILNALKLGAAGAVAATSNVLTDIDVAIVREYQAGNLEKAQDYQNSIEEFRRILKYGSIPSVLKYALTYVGHDVGEARRPVLPVLDEYQQDIKDVLDSYFKEEN
ncbi:4-hydroxy-tetrahydrodipicolinate synthase [Granulicatella sp. zg-ZJ]|uniref:4-hydroxy-tetrahydrodipicolinate synthase n=1 Tax=Granulicatella sp. zg-ZJ TaxID=2678504 RepID=UPI0013D67A16|nr:4-hydroxy-tetrahydrodipicolinate synthase [Granulicatella sp. zg-ZJ]NEW62166.1 4-hydroxy-tetrahydrodipicolinate synthase [Granulicatella sp. zg-ZJ]